MSNPSIIYWLGRARELTLMEAAILMRSMGNYHLDPYWTVTASGYGNRTIEYMAERLPEFPIRKSTGIIQFDGGPVGRTRFTGTLATFIADRCLYTSFEHGSEYVESLFCYAKTLCV